MTGDARDIIRRPMVTEKSTDQMGKHNKYAFEVHPGANKIQIKRAVEEIFKVKVTAVNTVTLPGKVKRMGKFEGKRSDRKKAIVTVAAGQRIEIFEGL